MAAALFDARRALGKDPEQEPRTRVCSSPSKPPNGAPPGLHQRRRYRPPRARGGARGGGGRAGRGLRRSPLRQGGRVGRRGKGAGAGGGIGRARATHARVRPSLGGAHLPWPSPHADAAGGKQARPRPPGTLTSKFRRKSAHLDPANGQPDAPISPPAPPPHPGRSPPRAAPSAARWRGPARRLRAPPATTWAPSTRVGALRVKRGGSNKWFRAVVPAAGSSA